MSDIPLTPVEPHLVTGVESVAMGMTANNGQPLPPAVSLTVHALDAQTHEPIVIELALQQDTAVLLLSQVSYSLTEIQVHQCDTPGCPVHDWRNRGRQS